jgi:hypothetical protein
VSRSFNLAASVGVAMDADAFRERVVADKQTQLDRLGSGKLLVGLTGGDLRRESVLALATNSEHAARETFEGWAAEESDPDARAAFEDVAAQEADHYERVQALLDDDVEPAGGGVLHSYLRAREDTVDRVAAGMVGRPLYSVRAYTQMVSFFVNEADGATADELRALKEDTEATLERGCELLATRCTDDATAEGAVGTAAYTVQLVYDDYADALAELGLNAKSVC